MAQEPHPRVWLNSIIKCTCRTSARVCLFPPSLGEEPPPHVAGAALETKIKKTQMANNVCIRALCSFLNRLPVQTKKNVSYTSSFQPLWTWPVPLISCCLMKGFPSARSSVVSKKDIIIVLYNNRSFFHIVCPFSFCFFYFFYLSFFILF